MNKIFPICQLKPVRVVDIYLDHLFAFLSRNIYSFFWGGGGDNINISKFVWGNWRSTKFCGGITQQYLKVFGKNINIQNILGDIPDISKFFGGKMENFLTFGA